MNWITANPGWSGALIFVIAFIESLVVVGFFLPGIFILFGVGTLIGLGGLSAWPVLVGGSFGAFFGDILSFYIGHRYRRHLEDFWPFSRYPEMLRRGADFFRRHGAKSVVAGRFIGPLRPIIPVSAGMLGMAPARFLAVCIPACIFWTPAYLIPGMVFGASLEVASQYAGRLALVVASLVTILWLTLWALRSLYTLFAVYSARWLRHAIRWTRRHPLLGRITGPILDPSQPETLSVTMLGLLLVFTLWGMMLLLFLSPFGSQPQAMDQAMLTFTESVRNHFADPFMVGVSQLSRWGVLIPTAFATLAWLLGAQRLTAAVHWLVAMAGGLVLQWLIGWALRSTPALSAAGQDKWFEPSTPMTLATVVLGFFCVMVAKELHRRHRKWPYLASGGLLTLLLIARIYLGLDWLSGALVGAILGLCWTAIVGIAYRQRALRPFSGAIACGIFFGTLAITLAWQVDDRLEDDLSTLRLTLPEIRMDGDAWWDEGWKSLAAERSRLKNVSARRFNLQSVVSVEQFRKDLEAQGWRVADPAGGKWLLMALNPEPTVGTLPLVGKDYLGQSEVLVMSRASADPKRQRVVRLWDSGARIEPGGQPVFLGLLSDDTLVRSLWLFSYWRSNDVAPDALNDFVTSLADVRSRWANDSLALIRPLDLPEAGARSPAVAVIAPADR